MHKEYFLEGLNEAQRDAVMHGEGPALVVAGPGSGKTTVIIRRLLFLIRVKKVAADKILVITFTKEAAVSMQEKYKKETKNTFSTHQLTKGIVDFATFHSYFYQIIKSISKYSDFSLITQIEKEKIAEMILKKEGLEEITPYHIRNFLSEISFYKNTGRYKNDNELENWLELFHTYQQMLEKNKKMDFDDMLYLCHKELLENQELLEFWQNRYLYIMIDEYQDINPVQYKIMRMLSGNKSNILVVGDDDQAIYGFRGSDTASFQKFQKDYHPITKIFLLQNYRCKDVIVKASKKLIETNSERERKELAAVIQNEYMGKIEAVGSCDRETGMESLTSRLKKLNIDKMNQQAILFRTNASMQIFACFLTGKKIPFIIREKSKSIYEHFIVCDILDYFRAANGMNERSLYIRIFQKLRMGREGLRQEEIDLEDVKAFYKKEAFKSKETVEKIEALERHLNRLKKMRPSLGIRYIMHGMDYTGHLIRKNNDARDLPSDWINLLEWLCEDSKDYLDFNDWQNHIEEYKKKLYNLNFSDSQPTKGIHLMTLHASKGLEFQKVYLWDVSEGNIPQYHKGEELSRERLEEERRLCYVGVTRATEEVELYYYEGAKGTPVFPSRFLEEMGLI